MCTLVIMCSGQDVIIYDVQLKKNLHQALTKKTNSIRGLKVNSFSIVSSITRFSYEGNVCVKKSNYAYIEAQT